MRILYYGQAVGNSGSRVRGMRALGHEVRQLDFVCPPGAASRLLLSAEWRVCNGPLTLMSNRALLRAALEFKPELLWTEMGRLIYPGTLRRIKEHCGSTLVNSYSDDFRNPRLRSRHYDRSIPLYDFIFTPREVNFEEYRRYGARGVGRFWKGYDEDRVFPEPLTPAQQEQYGADVVFVGHGEASRVEPLAAVAEFVPNLKVWGDEWNRLDVPEPLRSKIAFRGAEGHEYRLALVGGKIALHFLSRWNRDTQSSRSFEIPACGVFMLAERTQDHLACFEEGKEAEFFSSTQEMTEKIRFYLADDEARRRIARAGYQRCLNSGYSNLGRIRQMLELATGRPQPQPRSPEARFASTNTP